jgi:hypothetical protein
MRKKGPAQEEIRELGPCPTAAQELYASSGLMSTIFMDKDVYHRFRSARATLFMLALESPVPQPAGINS